MTEEEVNAEIGRLVTRYRDRLKEHAALRSKIGATVNSMRAVVDSAMAGDRFTPTAIRRDDVPDGGWQELAGLLDSFRNCRDDLKDIEHDLRTAGLEGLIRSH